MNDVTFEYKGGLITATYIGGKCMWRGAVPVSAGDWLAIDMETGAPIVSKGVNPKLTWLKRLWDWFKTK